MTVRTGRREDHSGEAMAMSYGGKWGLQSNAEAMWFSFGPEVKENIVEGQIAQVFCRGPLEHHDEGGGDSYDALYDRVQCALGSEARRVVLRIDSPGGVVAGLSECVASIQAERKRLGKPLYCLIDEMATSAGYALACACDEIILPPSGLTGSVGIISTMISYAAAAERRGVQCVVLTSGAAKSDGHPNVPITDQAAAREQARVEKLAVQFFKLAGKARGLSVDTLRGYQAGLFLGGQAVKNGLADAVMGWRELQATLASF
jgi:ClpP class serine protease